VTQSVDSAIVRIYTADLHGIGVGFVVSDGHILTCAHVVAGALGLSRDGVPSDLNQVYVNFPLLAPEEYFSTRVCHWEPDADVAGLKMTSDGPDGSHAVYLVTADHLWGHAFRAFGFPSGYTDGVWASGVLRGPTATGWVQVADVKMPGYWVQHGFSGTPVWDEQLNGVIGMVVVTDIDRTVEAAYVIPACILAQAWPDAVRVNRVRPLNDRATVERPGGEESGSVEIGDVHGDIRDAIIAGRDVHLNIGASREPRAPVSGLPTDRSALATLRQVLTERFQQEELRTLCFDLGIDWDDLPARGKAGKVRELVGYFARRRSIEKMIQFCERQRPDISWRDFGRMPD